MGARCPASAGGGATIHERWIRATRSQRRPPYSLRTRTHLAFVVEPDALWWAGGDGEAAWEAPARGGSVQWAVLHVLETRPSGARAEHPILVDLPAGWVPSRDVAGASWPRNLRFAGAGHVVFDTPWGGTCSIPFPPTGQWFAPPPNG